MNETGISERDRRVVREDGQRIVRAGCGERDGARIQNYTGGGIAATLDASYYKGSGARNGKEREFLAVEVEPVVYPGVGITSPQNGNNPQPGDPAPSLTNDSRNYMVADGKPPRKYIVRRLTPMECQRLQGFPNVAELNVGQMTRDEMAMFCLAEGLIRVNLDTGTIYGIRGPGGISMKEWRELKGTLQNGYVVHTLNLRGIKKQVKAHRIVWIAAHGMIPDGMVIDHINNNKTDNRLCNLQILSPEDNSTKARQDGLYMAGEKSATAKISDDDKKTIQFLYWHTDMLQKRIGEMFGLCQQRVSQIVHEDCGWCEGLGGSDSAIYKAYGNGLALPCAYDVLRRIANEYDQTAVQA